MPKTISMFAVLAGALLVGWGSASASGSTTCVSRSGCTFVVPPGVTSVTFTVYGAAGGATDQSGCQSPFPSTHGGLGAEASVTLPVQPGETFYLDVGTAGAPGACGKGGPGGAGGMSGEEGGSGGAPYYAGLAGGGGGGGASDVREGGDALSDRIVVAGGGGGGGSGYSGASGPDPSTDSRGGAGGGQPANGGDNGYASPQSNGFFGWGGGGGSASAPGAAGASSGSSRASAGSGGNGGDGGAGSAGFDPGAPGGFEPGGAGGGGGGGLFGGGGGGGGTDTASGGGGGGGSGGGSASGITYRNGVDAGNNGNGKIVVNVAVPPRCKVPKLKGKSLAAAKLAIRKAHCAVGKITRKHSTAKKGNVISQRPAPGTQLALGARVRVVVSSGRRR